MSGHGLPSRQRPTNLGVSLELMGSNGPLETMGCRRELLLLCRFAWKHGCHTFRIDVEDQKYQRLVAWVSPLVHEGVRFVDQGTRSPCFRLTVDRVGPGACDDEV